MTGIFAVSAFYKFVPLADAESWRNTLLEEAQRLAIRGSILLAPEGINGTIAGNPDSLNIMMTFIRSLAPFSGLESKESHAASMPFRRMKVRLKKEIVTMGVPGVDPNNLVGTYVAPADWNALISDPDVLVIDTRNSFEFHAGSFARAVNPETSSFGQFPAYVARELAGQQDRKIAMFCTGGIRCEKASSYMRQLGYRHVFHLKGGILKYLETVRQEDSLWHGKCFVFDERETLVHGLETARLNDE